MAQLIDNSGKWNERMVRESFLDEDATYIINIPLNPMLKEDEVI